MFVTSKGIPITGTASLNMSTESFRPILKQNHTLNAEPGTRNEIKLPTTDSCLLTPAQISSPKNVLTAQPMPKEMAVTPMLIPAISRKRFLKGKSLATEM